MNSDFRKRLLSGDVLVGTLITIPSAEVAEIMAGVGFDWLFIDTEHSPFNAHGAQTILQAAGQNCPCVVRVPANDEVWIKKAGVRLGIFAATAEAVEPYIQQHFTLLAIGTDGLHMAQNAKALLKALKQ